MITASLIGGAHMIFLDNINHKVASGHLAAALTVGVWKDRILGESTITAVPNSATWVLAGNNLQFSNELMRRNVPIRLDANVANPTLDRPMSTFKHDLTVWLKENRANLLWACHVLGLNWIQKGRPHNVQKHVHSFDAWSRVMGGIFEAAGIDGFLDNIQNYLGNRDEDIDVIRDFAKHLFEKFDTQKMTVREMYENSTNPFGKLDYDLPISGNNEHAQIISLGKFIQTQMVGCTFRIREAGEVGGTDEVLGKLVKIRQRNPSAYVWSVLPPQSPKN
ncbi:hypothetical protein [Hyphomicrobium sp. NDB2Meth4]|uniref:hypothetical protein n=1 Tax=Hyphomicrobium sp. NDB2Meth4 TaxID=1892846 RepID=UPI0009306005|nr:hypothetical protein [Hyphomicrobium sp. NDB2Meth4]